MVQINFALKEVNCKIVYYGPGMSGKTTNLEIVHQKAPESNKGDLTSISTDGDRTLFFDFMPLDLGTVAGMRTKFQLYTVPGQVYYNSTRKLVLQGCDGVIFIADSDPEKMPENIESYDNLIENLKEYGKDIRELPHVLQYNKRDLPNALSHPIVKAISEDQKFDKAGGGKFVHVDDVAGACIGALANEKAAGRPFNLVDCYARWADWGAIVADVLGVEAEIDFSSPETPHNEFTKDATRDVLGVGLSRGLDGIRAEVERLVVAMREDGSL